MMTRAALFAVAIFVALSAPTHAVAQPLNIGIILPLTGGYASVGRHMKNAAELSYRHLPAAVQQKLHISFEDDQLNAAQAVTAFTKLQQTSPLSAVVLMGGQSVGSVLPLASSRGVLSFCITADSTLVLGKPDAYQHWLSAGEQAAAVFSQLDKAPPKAIALVSTTQNAALTIMETFEREARRRGITIASKQDFDPKDTDFRTAIMRLKSAPPDAILAVLLAPHFSLFTKQLRELGVTTPIYGSANAEIVSEVAAANGAMEGLIYAAPDLQPSFLDEYQETYHSYPEFSAPNVYDIVQILGQAVANGAVTPATLRRYLAERRSFSGVMGTYAIEDGFRFAVHAVPKIVLHGRFEFLPPERARTVR